MIAFKLPHAAKIVVLIPTHNTWMADKQEVTSIIGAIWPAMRPPGTPRSTFIQVMPVAAHH
jgi:hypothetical protein